MKTGGAGAQEEITLSCNRLLQGAQGVGMRPRHSPPPRNEAKAEGVAAVARFVVAAIAAAMVKTGVQAQLVTLLLGS